MFFFKYLKEILEIKGGRKKNLDSEDMCLHHFQQT